MLPDDSVFERGVRQQYEINRARTPIERLLALCELLDAARAMAPRTPEAKEARRRALASREREREELRAFCRRHIALERGEPEAGRLPPA
jgi:hypothetical protein